VSYEIDCGILGDISIATDTVFEIVSEDGEILAEGMRYNRLSKKMQVKRELPAVELVIKTKAPKSQTLGLMKEVKPKFYLIQFGPEAKQKSFAVLEKLQKANLMATHSLLRDKLTGQMQSAEEKGVPYILLLGQKEALENSVVVRNTVNRSQSTIPIIELLPFLKKNLL
jgi:histidyl-tRNA synthetase